MEKKRIPDPDMAAELRQGAGREWSEEVAEDERLTELHRRRQLDLADVAKELVNRGDRVSVEFGGHSFSGAVVSAGADYAVVEGPGQTADILLGAARWSVIISGQPADGLPVRSESFRALLQEHAATGDTIRLALPEGDMVFGRLDVIAVDHVEMTDVDDRRLVVPIELILAVVRSSDSH